jgi:hypothetical protein
MMKVDCMLLKSQISFSIDWAGCKISDIVGCKIPDQVDTSLVSLMPYT